MCMVAHCVAQKAEIEVPSFLRESLGLLCDCYLPSKERIARCNVYSLKKKKKLINDAPQQYWSIILSNCINLFLVVIVLKCCIYTNFLHH